MQRREALKLIAAATVSSVIPRDLWALGQETHAQLAGSTQLRTLNAHQNATVATIAELIIPATNTPGAEAARVNEFIDLILTEWYEEDEKKRFLDGLANVDARSHDLFDKDFLDCGEKRQVEILKKLDEKVAEERPSIMPSILKRERTEPPQHFFSMMKRLTLFGYYTSEVGSEKELEYQVIPVEHGGCVPVEGDSKAGEGENGG